ncbi:uncharacterized protein LOC134834833 [Culicoides brevitarsis]|uniref:uncharacterized protein LOC134834833 n=1 Tax=Culicoides brevitarsis TaxID=469753 RepID=UPI00307BCB9B
MSQFKQTVNKALKPYTRPLAEVDHQNSVDLMLQLLEFYITNGFCSEDKIDKAITLAPDSQEYFHEALAGLVLLCKLYLRSPKGFVKLPELQEVVKDTKLKPEFIDIVVQKFIELKENSNVSSIERPIRLTAPKKFTYRINITNLIKQKSINQCTIVLQITLENGKVETFVMSIAMFHKLRFQVASALKAIHNLEGRASMKI